MTSLYEILDGREQRVEGIDPNATVLEGIARMARCQIGCLVVCEDDHLAGVLTERDYLQKVILRGRTSRTTLVREVMTPAALVAGLHDDGAESLRRMLAHQVKYLPVLEEGQVVGVLSRGDLMRALIAEPTRSSDRGSTGRFAIVDAPPDSSSLRTAG